MKKRILGIILCMLPFTGYSSIRIDHITVIDVVHSRVLYDQEIVIKNGKIFSVRPQPETSTPADTIIDGTGKIAMPGFVNTHTHLWQHIARGYYPNGILQEWIKIYRVAHYIDPEALSDVMLAACNNALLSGITTVSDFSSVNFTEYALDTVCSAMQRSGLDGVSMYWYPASFMPDHMKEKHIKRLQQKYHPNIQIGMAQGPLSFFSLTSVYSGIQLAKKLQIPLSEHVMENVKEQYDFYNTLKKYVNQYGDRLAGNDKDFLEKLLQDGPPSQVSAMEMLRRTAAQTLAVSNDALTAAEKQQLTALGASSKYISPIPLLDYLGALKNFIAIHSVWTLHDDIALFNKKGNKVYVSHNPESNMYLSSGIAPILDYLNAGVPVTLGTDGAASNDGIDFFSAMRAFWNLQKLKYLNSSAIKPLDAWDVIRAATLYGAEALGIAHNTGSITEGKEADLFLLSASSLGMSPLTHKNVLPLLIYSAGPRDVKYVISNGKIVVEKGALTQFDEHKLAAKLSAASQKAHEHVKQGKVIALSLSNTRDTLKYFSVRPKDSIHIVIENRQGRKKVNVQLLFSGTTFGGTVPSLMAPESRLRFPHDDPPDFWKLERRLRRKEKIILTKAKQSLEYNITLPNGKTITRKGVPREQLLLLLKD